MNSTIGFTIYILWGFITLLNSYIALYKKRSYLFWFFLSLLIGPVASVILFFIKEGQLRLDTERDIVKYLKRETRLKLLNWNHFNNLINVMNYFTEKELIKVKNYLEAEIHYGKIYFTYFAIVSSVLIANAVWWKNKIISFSDDYFKLTALLIFIIGWIITRSISIRTRIIKAIEYKVQSKTFK